MRTYRNREEALSKIAEMKAQLAGHRTREDRRSVAGLLIDIGAGYRSIEEYSEAIAAHSQALDLYQQLDDKYGQAIGHYPLGKDHEEANQWEQTLSHYQEVLDRLDDDKHGVQIDKTLDSIGWTYRRKGDTMESLEAWEKALPLFRQWNEQERVVLLLYNTGWLIANSPMPGRTGEAVAGLEEAAMIMRRGHMAFPCGMPYRDVGVMLAKIRDG